ncbi:DUF1178 family protein [Lentilitoribacter sp. EG35]|uniref:DUF1178 family protein n=1 Tax=Lentilitoribacter sp. EG35 TaxID=3234192 RepID=UPI00345FD58C
MIKFNLICNKHHDFEAWFSSSTDFDDQKDAGFVSCPICGSSVVEKALMVPAVATSRSKEKKQQMMKNTAQKEAMKAIQKMVTDVKENSENVGDQFPEEARKMHYGESDSRGIYGKASLDEVRELVDEGINVTPLPDLPDKQN